MRKYDRCELPTTSVDKFFHARARYSGVEMCINISDKFAVSPRRSDFLPIDVHGTREKLDVEA